MHDARIIKSCTLRQQSNDVMTHVTGRSHKRNTILFGQGTEVRQLKSWSAANLLQSRDDVDLTDDTSRDHDHPYLHGNAIIRTCMATRSSVPAWQHDHPYLHDNTIIRTCMATRTIIYCMGLHVAESNSLV